MIDLENASYYLVIKIFCNQERDIIMLFQTAYLKVILEQFEMSNHNLISTFINSGLLNIIISSSLDYQVLLNIIL